jgi:hypothetical protein
LLLQNTQKIPNPQSIVLNTVIRKTGSAKYIHLKIIPKYDLRIIKEDLSIQAYRFKILSLSPSKTYIKNILRRDDKFIKHNKVIIFLYF